MDTVKRGLRRLRAGFVLPLSLVTTVITLLLVGASATYCTTQFRTSQLYLSRTRCRLVAQSAIEMTKLVLMEKCGGELTGIPDPANPNFSVADTSGILDAVMTEVRKPEFAQRVPGVGSDMSVSVSVRQGTGDSRGYNFIFATAEHKAGGRSTTVTLQETIKIPLSSGSIFDYAYFANHDGHLPSQYMVINGDVRANQDFYITGAEINGYVYASNTVHFATEKNKWGWWDDKDPTIRSFDSYNSTYRNGSKKDLSTYAKARPTNPLSRNGESWVGGFEAVDATQEESNSMPSGLSPLEQFFWYLTHGRGGGTTTKTVSAPTLTDEIKPSEAVTESKEDYIVNALAVHDDDVHRFLWFSYTMPGKQIDRSPGILKMPQIAWTDAGLKQYKDYAATAKTVKGKTGGSLVCSNCFVNAAGQAEQLSLELKLPWNWGGESLWQNKTPEPFPGEPQQPTRGIADPFNPQEHLDDADFNQEWLNRVTEEEFSRNATRSEAAGLVPPGGVLVYDCIDAAAYERLSPADQAKWRTFAVRQSDGIVNGWVGTIKEGNHVGSSLVFDNVDFEKALRENFSVTDAQDITVKFSDTDKWALEKYETRTDQIDVTKPGKQIDESVYTAWVSLLGYKTTRPTTGSGWFAREDTSWEAVSESYTSSGFGGWNRTKDSYYYSVAEERCFNADSDEYSQVVRDIASESRNKSYGLAAVSCSWPQTTKTGYYKSTGSDGYLAFDIVRHRKTYADGTAFGTPTYEVVQNVVSGRRSGVTRSEMDIQIPAKESVTRYISYYYKPEPAGYVEISMVPGEKKVAVLNVVYFSDLLDNPSVPTVRKLVETKYLELHKYSDRRVSGYETMSSRDSGVIHTGYSYTKTGDMNGLLVAISGGRKKAGSSTAYELTLDALSQYCRETYSLSEDAVLNAFNKSNSGWSERESSALDPEYYSPTVSGYLAARIYGVFAGDKVVRYEIDYEFVSTDDKTADEKNAPDTDVLEVKYVELHTYKSYIGGSTYGYAKISGRTDGCVRTIGSSQRYFLKRDFQAQIEELDGAYGINANSIMWNFTPPEGWAYPTSGGSGYGYYSTSDSGAGYLVIKVVIRRQPGKEPTYELQYGYQDVRPSGEDGEISRTGLPNTTDIPVYAHISEAAWRTKDYLEKRNWVPVKMTKSWCLNQKEESELYGQIFDKGEIESAATRIYNANKSKSQYDNVAEIADEVRKLFAEGGEAYADGWTGSCTGGYMSQYPMGYLRITVEPGERTKSTFNAAYQYLSVDSGDIKTTDKRTISDVGYYRDNPGELGTHLAEIDEYRAYAEQKQREAQTVLDRKYQADMETYRTEHAAWEQSRDEEWAKNTPEGYQLDGGVYRPRGDTTKIVRQLRQIFVTGGYKVDVAEMNQCGSSEDLILTRYEGAAQTRLGAGDTTAELRPFREDYGNCNRKADKFGAASDKGAVILIGTWDCPITIDGPVVFESDVIIRGFVQGRGTIYSGRNIHVIGDINYKNPPYWPYNGGAEPDTKGKDLLVLISRGSIVFGNYVKDAASNTSMDESWSGSDSLLSGNYINGQANTADKTSRWGKNNTYVPYVEMDYTKSDTKGWTKNKVVFDKTNQRLDKTQVKYYESVVGDYVFISKNKDSDASLPDVSGALTKYGCSSRFAQTWDLNFGKSTLQNAEYFHPHFPYQSKVLDAFAKHKGWGESERVGQTTRKTMAEIWNTHRAEIWSFFTTTGTDGYGGYGGDGRSQSDVTEIQDVNAVLYSSMGIFGIIGGKYSPVTINGAVIGQDEALFPFTQYQAKRKLWWQWWKPRTTTETSQLAMTINWDIRLNLKSTESKRNQEGENELSPPITSEEVDSGNANAPKILSWQEVPDSFNDEYHGD